MGCRRCAGSGSWRGPKLSLAYPILSLTFPIVLGLSAVFFAETITPLRWAGVGVIVVGVSLLART